MRFIRSCENAYDLIIVDSTDPFGPGEGLFTREFYGSCYKALREDGIMVNQHESPFYPEDAAACQRAHKRIVESFPISRTLAVWICVQKIPSPEGSAGGGMEHAGTFLQILYNDAA